MAWWRVLQRALASAVRHGALDWAASLAYYFFFALFPTVLLVAALLSTLHMAGLVDHLVWAFSRDLPPEASDLVAKQLTALLTQHVPGLISMNFVLLVYSGSQGISGLMGALNAAYGVKETRSYARRLGISFVLTFTAGALVGLALMLLVMGERVVTLVAGPIRWGTWLHIMWPVLRWGAVAAAFFVAVTMLYQIAPNARRTERGLLTAVASALVLWFVASGILAAYMKAYSDYSKIYGTLGAIIALMLWFYVLALALLLGAEIHAQALHAHGIVPVVKKEDPAPHQRAA